MSNGVKLSLALLVAVWLGQQGAGAAEIAGRITVNGQERSYFVVTPGSAAPRRLPTVIVLHGALMDGRWMQETMGLDPIARKEGFLAVYPDALHRLWNDGRRYKRVFWRRDRERTDDVAFLKRLTGRLVDQGLTDPDRVYLIGVSHGGMLAFRAACEAAETFAAVGVVIANMPVDVARTCKPHRGMPIIVINATDDPLMPWNGGPLGYLGQQGAVISTPDSIDFWRRNNGCAAKAEKRALPDKDPSDGTTTSAKQYIACGTGAPVVLVTVEGGGHVPPGADMGPLVTAVMGKANKDISAADLSWKFFRQFPPSR